jgi:transposase
VDENLDKLFDAMDKANVKITFGLQPYHIEAIEKELKRWNDMPPLVSFPDQKPDPKYIKYVWEKLGKELHWEPFTLCLYYFEYLEEINKKS